jgi:hypothetical protein
LPPTRGEAHKFGAPISGDDPSELLTGRFGMRSDVSPDWNPLEALLSCARHIHDLEDAFLDAPIEPVA